MLLLRVVASADVAPAVLGYLESLDEVGSLTHLPGAGRKPAGDVIHCVVPSDSCSAVISALRQLGVLDRGSITLDRLEAAIAVSATSTDADAADAVVWEELEARIATSAGLSVSYLVYMAAATMIAAIGILTDSVVLIVGAMVVGPEFGPLAAVCVGAIQRRYGLARRAAIALGVGFALAFAMALAATLMFRALGLAPAQLDPALRPATLFISHPDPYSGVVAVLAGVVGMLSLTTASMGTLIGVLISVTTIPAAANVGVAIAYRDIDEMTGSLLQLALNLGLLLVAGFATLKLQRAAFTRRVALLLGRLRHTPRRGARGRRNETR